MTNDEVLRAFLRAACLERRRVWLSQPVRYRRLRRAAAKYGRFR